MHQTRQKGLKQYTSTITFNHPFKIIVGGPTRSSNIIWFASLSQKSFRTDKTYTIQNYMVLHALATYAHSTEKVNA